MRDIDDHVVEKFASKWKELGSQLNVGGDLIRNIEYDFPNNCERCCRIMLDKWLDETAHPTWEALINALDKISDNATNADDTGLYDSYCYCLSIDLYNLDLCFKTLNVVYKLKNYVCILFAIWFPRMLSSKQSSTLLGL